MFSAVGRLLWISPMCKFSEDLRGYRYLEMVFGADEGKLRGWFLDECEGDYSVRISTPKGQSRVVNIHKIRLGENWLVVGAAGALTKPDVISMDDPTGGGGGGGGGASKSPGHLGAGAWLCGTKCVYRSKRSRAATQTSTAWSMICDCDRTPVVE